MGGDHNPNRPAQGMADRPPVRTPLDQLTADVHDLAGNMLVPPNIRNTLRLAVQVLADQERRLKVLEQRQNVLHERVVQLEDARHG